MQIEEELSREDLENMIEETLQELDLEYDERAQREISRAIGLGLRAVERDKASPGEAVDTLRRMLDFGRSMPKSRGMTASDVIRSIKAHGALCPNIYCPDKE